MASGAGEVFVVRCLRGTIEARHTRQALGHARVVGIKTCHAGLGLMAAHRTEESPGADTSSVAVDGTTGRCRLHTIVARIALPLGCSESSSVAIHALGAVGALIDSLQSRSVAEGARGTGGGLLAARQTVEANGAIATRTACVEGSLCGLGTQATHVPCATHFIRGDETRDGTGQSAFAQPALGLLRQTSPIAVRAWRAVLDGTRSGGGGAEFPHGAKHRVGGIEGTVETCRAGQARILAPQGLVGALWAGSGG